jgi:hypothetical protein
LSDAFTQALLGGASVVLVTQCRQTLREHFFTDGTV